MNDVLSPWPPAYTLKKHARAKHVKLKASVRSGLEIVVPPRFNPKKIPEILEINKKWIVNQLEQIQTQLNLTDRDAYPKEILLTALNQTWKVELISSNRKKLKLLPRAQEQELVLFGDVTDIANCKKLLARWIKKQAEKYLPLRLQELSQLSGLVYKDVMIRGQRSRWGSCSADKSLNLNFKLLFLPSALVDHIIIHELCHTIHMDHSAKFWRLVSTFDPLWKQHCREVKRSEKFVPAWLELLC